MKEMKRRRRKMSTFKNASLHSSGTSGKYVVIPFMESRNESFKQSNNNIIINNNSKDIFWKIKL